MTWISSHYKITKDAFESRYYGDKESLRSIARSLEVSQGPFADVLRKAGMQLRNPKEADLAAIETCSRRTYAVNQQFFDTWTTEMAWVLGLLAADGNVGDALPNVSLVSTDIELTDKFKQAVGYTGPVQWNPHGEFHVVRIFSYQMANRLKQLGITPRKTLTLQMPPVPPEYLSHFVRGYCDGDGCISIKRAKGRFDKLAVRLCSASEDLIDQLHTALIETKILCRKRLLPRPDRERDQYRICAVGYDAFELCEFMYQECPDTLCLTRKRQVYLDYAALHGWRYTNGPIRNRWEKKPCVIDGCTGLVHARSMCQKHYSRDWKRRRRAQ